MSPAAAGNRLSELVHTLKFIDEELVRAKTEFAEKRRDPSAAMKEVSERVCLLARERHRYQAELDREVDKIIPFFEQAEAMLLR